MYPNSTQEDELNDHLDICRHLYNRILDELKIEKRSMYAMTNQIPKWKKINPELKKPYSKVLQMVNQQVFANIKGLAISKRNGNRIGRLRYKTSINSMKTLNYNQSGFDIEENHNRIRFSKIGWIRTIVHRSIPENGKIKGIIIKRTDTGKWFAIVQIEMDFEIFRKTGKDVGLDMGISSFVTDSDKTRVEYPNNIDKTLDKIKRLQCDLSGKKRCSNNYYRTKDKLRKVYERLNDQRRDFLHKLSRYYIRNYDRIAVEDLNIAGMVQQKWSKSLNRHILDASWKTFFDMLDYKAERAGRKVIKVDPRGTSKRCYVCSEEVDKKLSDRLHSCPNCGFEADRDWNASLNIRHEMYIAYHQQDDDRSQGLASLPVEDNPLLVAISAKEVVAGKIFC